MAESLLEPSQGSCLQARYLTLADADLLSTRLRNGDRNECLALGYHPLTALGFAAFKFYIGAARCDLSAARAMAVTSSLRQEISGAPYLVGAFGWDHQSVWSVWAPLSKAEGRSLMLETPRWCKWMSSTALLKPLWNIVMASNRPAIKWLEHSGCFTIDRSTPQVHGGQAFWPFVMKPIEEMPS